MKRVINCSIDSTTLDRYIEEFSEKYPNNVRIAILTRGRDRYEAKIVIYSDGNNSIEKAKETLADLEEAIKDAEDFNAKFYK